MLWIQKVGRIWQSFSLSPRTSTPETGSHTRLPTLMFSNLISQCSKLKCVTWLLLSKALARTCTLQSSGEAGTDNDFQHHACTVAKSMRASHTMSFLEKFSSTMQVSCRTAANAWPSNHPQNGSISIGMIWWSFLILFQSLHAFTSVRPAS